MTNPTQILIEACRQNDPKAQLGLYRQYAKAMYNTALRMLQQQDKAEDVVQEAFIKAFQKLDVGNVRIEASDNIEPYILTSVENEEITIKLKEGFSYSLRHKLQVYVPVNERLEQIILSGSGDISMREQINVGNLKCFLSGSGDININVNASHLNLSLSGSGDLIAKGNCPEIEISLVGSGDISTESIKAERVKVTVSGSGDVDVYASKSIKAKVSGSGDVSVKGKPELEDTHVSGSGEIYFE